MQYILGIDQSTQGTKAILADEEGKIIGRSDKSHRQLVNEYGWVSHDLEEIYRNVIFQRKRLWKRLRLKEGRLSV